MNLSTVKAKIAEYPISVVSVVIAVVSLGLHLLELGH